MLESLCNALHCILAMMAKKTLLNFTKLSFISEEQETHLITDTAS